MHSVSSCMQDEARQPEGRLPTVLPEAVQEAQELRARGKSTVACHMAASRSRLEWDTRQAGLWAWSNVQLAAQRIRLGKSTSKA